MGCKYKVIWVISSEETSVGDTSTWQAAQLALYFYKNFCNQLSGWSQVISGFLPFINQIISIVLSILTSRCSDWLVLYTILCYPNIYNQMMIIIYVISTLFKVITNILLVGFVFYILCIMLLGVPFIFPCYVIINNNK